MEEDMPYFGTGSPVVTRGGRVVTLTSERFPGPPAQWIGMDRLGETTVILTEDIVGVVRGWTPQDIDRSPAFAARNEETSTA